MKKTLLLLLFISSISFAQVNGRKPTTEYIYKIEKSLLNLDTIQSKLLATNMAKLFRNDYRFFKLKITPKLNNYRYYFIPSNLTAQQKIHLKEFGTLDEVLKIDFGYYMDGANEDLETPGVLKLKFKHVEGRFLDVFPIWEKYFLNGTTKARVLDYDDRALRVNKYWVDIRKIDNSKFWGITGS